MPDLPSSPATPLTKRRLDEAAASLTPKLKRRCGSDIFSPSSLTSDRPASPRVDRHKDFNPWDRAALLDRIATFKIHTWRVEPTALSPVACALHGWANPGQTDTVQCGFCRAIIHIDAAGIPLTPGSAPRDRIVAEYVKQLTEAHHATCPWRQQPCEPSLYTVRYQPAEDMLEDLRDAAKVVHSQVLTTTVGVAPTHPALAAPLSPQLCRKLAALAAGKPMGDSTPSPSAEPRIPEDSRGSKAELESQPLGHLSYGVTNALLHLFGWELDRAVDRDIARCPMCFRQVALWMFRRYDSEVTSSGPITPAQRPMAAPKATPHPPIVKPESPAKFELKSDEDKGDGDDEEGDDDDDVPIKQESDVEHEAGEGKDDSVSKIDAGTLPPFDVIREHRSFCYWVNPDPREAEGKSTAKLNEETAELSDSEQPWQRTIRLLCNTTSESQTPTRPAVDTQDPDEVLLYVRKLLG